jgi:hypothetical protein
MHLELSVHDHESLFTVTGSVDTVDVPRLRGHILEALDEDGDVLLDMRRAGPVSDHLMAALTAARSRAKHLRHRVVVVDDDDGPTAGSLRRHGMQFRIPIYRLPADATAGLRADRAARARLTLGGSAAPPDAPDDPADDERADDVRVEPAVQAGRALWAAAAERPAGTARRP